MLKSTQMFPGHLQQAVNPAEPLAIASSIEPKPLPQLGTKFEPRDMATFVELLRSQHREDTVLFVGHANTVPALITALGHTVEIKIPEAEYDNLFVLSPKSEDAPTLLLWLRFN